MKKRIKAIILSSLICASAISSAGCTLGNLTSSEKASEVVVEKPSHNDKLDVKKEKTESNENSDVTSDEYISDYESENDEPTTQKKSAKKSDSTPNSKHTEEKELPTYSDIEIFQENGIFPSGKYILGEEMPEGIYLFKADQTGHGVEGVYADPHENQQISAAYVHFDGSRIAELKGNGYVHFSWCTAYDLSKHPEIVNDPFESSGMFIVGRDIEPGEYHLVPDDGEYGEYAEWHIYSSINCIAPVERASGYGVEGDSIADTAITLKDGEFLETQFCKVAK